MADIEEDNLGGGVDGLINDSVPGLLLKLVEAMILSKHYYGLKS